MGRALYSASISAFLDEDPQRILGILADHYSFGLETTQRDAWREEIEILKKILIPYRNLGSVYFEYSIPRLGKYIDVLAVIGSVIFVLEFKVGEAEYKSHAIDQVYDYALDLKNFHETSHEQLIVPILIATDADILETKIELTPQNDLIIAPLLCNQENLGMAIDSALHQSNNPPIDCSMWERGRYCPTPTIIEAATALYRGHSVQEISRSDAGAINLSKTSETVSEIIRTARAHSQKVICFVTGVPGAGKTLVGLNIATSHFDKTNDLYSVFLSGNGPLVQIMCEALARDRVRQGKEKNKKVNKSTIKDEIKAFIQNVHHFRDECLEDLHKPPIEHVALFDEAQRAWDKKQTVKFMREKKRYSDFEQSEPEFLIACMDRHTDWSVIICLVGGGQEINTGEAGISEWIEALNSSFPHWHIYVSPQLQDSEYGSGSVFDQIKNRTHVKFNRDLHLSVSMRSFRAENVSLLVKQLLDLDTKSAIETHELLRKKYPIVITRDLERAKIWIREHARGTERYGIVASSEAQRLKPLAIDVKSEMDPVHWFLDGKDDVRSSYYMEEVATEFQVQGLELDWACITWDADFRYNPNGWEHRSFVGKKWNEIKKIERQTYQKNAYRVLLTRARQGMVIVIPNGDLLDPTRKPEYYDPTYEYLRRLGLETI